MIPDFGTPLEGGPLAGRRIPGREGPVRGISESASPYRPVSPTVMESLFSCFKDCDHGIMVDQAARKPLSGFREGALDGEKDERSGRECLRPFRFFHRGFSPCYDMGRLSAREGGKGRRFFLRRGRQEMRDAPCASHLRDESRFVPLSYEPAGRI